MSNVLIGIDDTDNAESRGTGYRARELAALLSRLNLGNIRGITRHQLLFDERIPFTSHNSTACILMESKGGIQPEMISLAENYLADNAAEGSDAGMCICNVSDVHEEIIKWGLRAKAEILEMKEAMDIAERNRMYLKGFCGTKGGMIGALAAVGLRQTGNDGRFLQIKGMREYTGVFTAEEIYEKTGVELINSVDNRKISNFDKILLEEWWRPVLRNHQAELIVEPFETDYC